MSDYVLEFGDAEAIDRPRIEQKPWMKTKTMSLVTADMLPGVIDACIKSGSYGLDLETEGLDNRLKQSGEETKETRDRVVGICLSPDGVRGYYIPVGHRLANGEASPHNLPGMLVSREMTRLTSSKSVARFHHGKFDQEFCQHNGVGTGLPWATWDAPTAWEDSLILAYLRDTRARQKGLKHLSKVDLGMEMIELKDLFPSDHAGPLNFALLDPSWDPVVWYGCSDGICTWLLADKLLPQVVPGQPAVYKIEKLCVAATRWMERNLITVNRSKAAELITIGQKEMHAALLDVYAGASELLGRDVAPSWVRLMQTGKVVFDDPKNSLTMQIERFRQEAIRTCPDPSAKHVDDDDREWPMVYDVLSPQQLGPMFEELGVPGLVCTEKSGQIKTTKAELDRITMTAGTQFPFMRRIKRFRETLKALSTYLLPLWTDSADRNVGPLSEPLPEGLGYLRVNFDPHKVDTGRFSTPGRKIKRKFDTMQGGTSYPLHGTPSMADTNRPECLLRIRECFVARPGKILVAVDFAGVELRIVTNLSREPKWIAEFFRCADCGKEFDRGEPGVTPEPPPPYCPKCGSDKIGDLHTLTALTIYGAEAKSRPDWKKLRGSAKSLNFALCYGGGAMSVSRTVGVDENEAARIKASYDRTYIGLRTWWDSQHAFGRQHGFVETAFGRRYPVPDINHHKRGFRAKAERNSVNGPVQAGSADITKIAMALIHLECKKRGWLNKCMMTITMHDELVFEIDEDIFEEAIFMIRQIMTRNQLVLARGWPVPLTVDVEFGKDWTVPYDLKKLERKGVPPEIAHLLPRTAAAVAHAGEPAKPLPKSEKEKSSWAKPVEDDDDDEDAEGEGAETTVGDSEAETLEEPEEGLDLEPVSEMAGIVQEALPPIEVVSPDAPAMDKVREMPMPAQPIQKGDIWTYQLKAPLKVGTAMALADVIHRSKGRGTRQLHLVSKQGVVLDGWTDGPVLVNDQMFMLLAESKGI